MRKLILTLIVLTFAISLTAGAAFAVTPANTLIINNATLSFNDGTGPQTETASVTVTVDLQAVAPVLSEPLDQTTLYTGDDTQLTFNYTITSGSNGPDTYTLAGSIPGATPPTNATGADAVTLPASVILGASVTSADTSDVLTIQVPSDGGAADAIVNGIESGDTIVVNIAGTDEVVTVDTVTDPGGSGTATITLLGTTPLTASAAAGTPVLEQKAFTLTVDSGLISTVGTNITVTAEVTATNTNGDDDVDDVIATYTNGSATLTKYVRNVTTGTAGTSAAASFTIDGTTADFYTAGVTGEPLQTLEYVLVAENVGTGELSAAVISDILPVTFVDFKTGAYNTGADDVFFIDTTPATDSFPADGGDLADYTSPDLTVDVVGDLADAVATAGKIPAGDTVTIAYQVTIK